MTQDKDRAAFEAQIELPPLVGILGMLPDHQKTVIEAYRKRQGEVVVTKDESGAIVAVTRQDDEGKILSVIAEADRKRRGEPVYLLAETDGMWSETNEATFLWWKANSPRAARVLYTAPQPAEPVKVPTKWSGWACQYPGKMPRLYGDKSIAMLNHHPEEGDRLLYLVEQSNPIPEPVKGPSDDELLDQALRERDAASEMADKLADAIAKHLGVEIGEHSSANHPWYRAFDAIEASQPVEPVNPPTREQIREVFLENGFTIKPGQDDLKEYVYEAARDLLSRYGNAVQTNKETP